MKFLATTLLSTIIGTAAMAQQVPAKPQQKPIAITGATAHVGNGEVIENAVITFENGKITNILEGSTIRLDPANTDIINATGKHVYPGLIAPNTNLGLAEVEALKQTRDFNELGSMNPNVRALIAYNTDSKVTPTVRSNGVLIAQVTPRGGRISGMSSIMNLDGWNWEDAALLPDDGIYLNWPRMFTYSGWWAAPGGVKKSENYDKQVDEIKDFFLEAKAYAERKSPNPVNLKMESMRLLFSKNRTLFIRADYVKEIMAAVQFADEMGVKMVIAGGEDAHLATDLLKSKNIAVILTPLHSLPNNDDDDVALPYKRAKLLQDAGVLFCLSVGDFWQQRNLPFQAGTAVAYGLTKEQALQAITLNTAKILSIDGSVGSLKVGKEATLIISEGDILDMRTSNVTHAFISGRQIDLNNKQKDLYNKFKDKYNNQ
ncbi:MAG: imidazolonepropionase-like amidohydrolase [Sphingobacteriales bacterium]|jgi:imidazolonepropionase-like amidohydrolase